MFKNIEAYAEHSFASHKERSSLKAVTSHSNTDADSHIFEPEGLQIGTALLTADDFSRITAYHPPAPHVCFGKLPVDQPEPGAMLAWLLHTDFFDRLAVQSGLKTTTSSRTIAKIISYAYGPEALRIGTALLSADDLRNFPAYYLAAPNVRFAKLPPTQSKFEERLAWMLHAGCRSADPEKAQAARRAADEIIETLELGPIEWLASELCDAHKHAPEMVDALMQNDFEQATEMIELERYGEMVPLEAAELVASTVAYSGAFDAQRQSALGWRQLYRPYEAPLRLASDGSGLPAAYTTAQVYQPAIDIAILLEKLRGILEKNIAEGRNCISDNRNILGIYRQLKALGFDWLTRDFAEKLEASLNDLEAASLLDSLSAMGKNAIQIRINLELARGPQGNARIDKAISPTSIVTRVAIVVARACDLSLAGRGRIQSYNFALLLRQPIPVTLLHKSDDATDANRVVRQALHLFRVLFLQDPDHLKRGTKKAWIFGKAPHILPDEDDRRGHEVIGEARKYLMARENFEFTTLVGWESKRKKDAIPDDFWLLAA